MPASAMRLKKCPKCGSIQLIDTAFCSWCAHRFSTSFGPPLVYARAAPCMGVSYMSQSREVAVSGERAMILDMIPIPRRDEWLRLGIVVASVVLAFLILYTALRSISFPAPTPTAPKSQPIEREAGGVQATTDPKSVLPKPLRTYPDLLDGAVKTSERETSNL
jgi:hypothetical protein